MLIVILASSHTDINREVSWDVDQPVYMCYVDLEKAFSYVPPDILWVLQEYGVGWLLLRALVSFFSSKSYFCVNAAFLKSQYST